MIGLRFVLKNNKKFETMSDEQVVSLAQSGDNDAMDYIVSKYAAFVKMRSGSYFLPGAEKDDLVQEGFIGLYKAIKSFDCDKRAQFKTFAGVCIIRQMITAVKSSTRKKNKPLNHYISIHDQDSSGNDMQEYRMYADVNNVNPESIMIEKENVEDMELEISKLLSDFENNVLSLYLNGASYKKIAHRLGREPKAIDNALSRIKKKIEKYLADE